MMPNPLMPNLILLIAITIAVNPVVCENINGVLNYKCFYALLLIADPEK